MTKEIWKYNLVLEDIAKIMMPKGAEVLTVQYQEGQGMQMWALVDPDKDREERKFETFGTGHPIECGEDISRTYIGTYQRGGFVGHVFERLKAK